MALKEDYLDDILDTSANEKRKYRMINNADGTISLEDVTEYSQNGDNFGAFDINITNKTVNELIAMGLNVRCNSETGYLEVFVDGAWEQTDIKCIENKFDILKDGVLIGGTITVNKETNGYARFENGLIKIGTTTYGNSHVNATINQEVDFTNYNKLKITVSSYNKKIRAYILSVIPDSISYDTSIIVSKIEIEEAGIFEIDTSEINGEYYITFSDTGTDYGESHVSKIVLTKE